MVERGNGGSARAQALVFVGGPPGVGKTTACRLLYRRLRNSIYVEADDLWCRMNPFRVDAVTVSMVERNVAAVLRNFLEAGFDYVILSWVLHQEEVVRRILCALDGLEFSFSWLTLVCEEQVLRERWASTHPGDSGVEHALGRLREARLLAHTRHLDTSSLSVDAVVENALQRIEERREAASGPWWQRCRPTSGCS